MKWMADYQLFLFDFDGLLVNTEEIHYRAYQKMCRGRGLELPWDFQRYCIMAHYDATKLQKAIYADVPLLYEMEPNWSVLYSEKKAAMMELLKGGSVHLMPGVLVLLQELAEKGISRCVVTNSPDEQINIIKDHNPILKSIPYWFTRETYQEPKPNPECYLKAIEKLGHKGTKIIGFEDTPRGVSALMQTPARPILICKVPYPEIPMFVRKGATHFCSLEDLPQDELEIQLAS